MVLTSNPKLPPARIKAFLSCSIRKVDRPLAAIITNDRGGDALDSILAAVSAYHHAARFTLDRHAMIRARTDLIEGQYFAEDALDGESPVA